jgi:hypothetical protein
VDDSKQKELIAHVNDIIKGRGSRQKQMQLLDEKISDLYGLTQDERQMIRASIK